MVVQEHSSEGVEKIEEDELVLVGGIVFVEGIDDEQLQERVEQIDKGEPLLGVETGDVVVQEHSWEGVEKIEDELLLGEGIVLVEGIVLGVGVVFLKGG